MSSDAVGWTIRHSPYKGAAYTVHLMVADTVNDQNDNRFFMAIGNLAKKARCSRATCSEIVGRMVVDGYVECLDPSPTTGAPIPYVFLFPDAAVVFETRRKPKGGVQKGDTPTKRKATPGVGSGGGGCPESGHRVSEDPTQTQENATRSQGDNPPAANGGEEDDQATRARELVKAHWDQCKATGQPTPTLRAVKGNPFLALSSIVANLLAAGYAEDAVADALVHTQTFTTNGLTFTLRQRAGRRPPTATRDAWGDTSGVVEL